MGIWGLTTFVNGQPDLFWADYELKNTYVIIDGKNLPHSVTEDSDIDNRFGSDYNACYKHFWDFFAKLLWCNVTPIVILGGAHEHKRKEKHALNKTQKIEQLKRLGKGETVNEKRLGIFMTYVFVEAMRDLDVIHCRSLFEGNDDIVALAQHLDCPVLGRDSDYFIYNVKYLALESLKFDQVESRNSLKCRIFLRESFQRHYCIQPDVMLLLAAVLGCSFSRRDMFLPFYKDIRHSDQPSDVINALEWFRGKTFDNAFSLILRKCNSSPEVRHVIRIVVDSYTNLSATVAPTLRKQADEKLKLRLENIKEMRLAGYPELDSVPPSILDKVRECRLPAYMLDMVLTNTFQGRCKLEDISKLTNNTYCLNIIRGIYTIMLRYKSEKPPLRFSMRFGEDFDEMILGVLPWFDIGPTPLPGATREKIFYRVLEMNEFDSEIPTVFPDEWHLFVLTFIFWTKQLGKDLTRAHVHAILLNLIALQIVEKKIGFFPSIEEFEAAYGSVYYRDPFEYSGENFVELVKKIDDIDCVALARLFTSSRILKSQKVNVSSVWTLQIFSAFQLMLWYIGDFSALINSPFIRLKHSEFVCGSLIYSLYRVLEKECDVDNYVREHILKSSPKIGALYMLLTDTLQRYFPDHACLCGKAECMIDELA